MSDALTRKEEPNAKAPAWVLTFADLMSLLLCFFVLLLSFSEMNLEKFKQVAGSMKFAFGLQREIEANEVPKGTSIIAQEFSPGRPMQTPINEIRETTMDENKQTLEFTDAMNEEREADDQFNGVAKALSEQTLADAEKLSNALAEEIEQGLIEVKSRGNRIMMRIRETVPFPSGEADLRDKFLPVLVKLRDVLTTIEGQIIVAGHTDDRPIRTARYRSNWDLSSARAVSVVHELLSQGLLAAERFLVEGHGAAHPVVANDTPANRAINRRVELTIVKGDDARGEELERGVGAIDQRSNDLTAARSAQDLEAHLPT